MATRSIDLGFKSFTLQNIKPFIHKKAVLKRKIPLAPHVPIGAVCRLGEGIITNEGIFLSYVVHGRRDTKHETDADIMYEDYIDRRDFFYYFRPDYS